VLRGPEPRSSAQLQAAPVTVPIAFEPSAGRFTHGVDFIARGPGYTLSLTRSAAIASVGSARIRTRILGARAAAPRGEQPRRGVVNWYMGPDRSKWRSGIPTFGAVRYRGIYPGTDLIYHGRSGTLEYDFHLAPGADPAAIALEFDSAPRLAANGDLLVGSGRQLRPIAFQTVGGKRVPVAASFRVSGKRVGFRLGGYDQRRPLVIDPQFAFKTYAGSGGQDAVNGVAAGGTHLYTGGTGSGSFYGGTSNANGNWIASLASDGTTAEWITFFGGSGSVTLHGIAVAPSGAVYGVGDASGNTLGTTAGALKQSQGIFDDDGFVIKLDGSTGTKLAATYLGGTNTDSNKSVAVDSSGNVYVAGTTRSDNMATVGALDTSLGGQDAFLAKVSSGLTSLTWYTYIGTSTFNDEGNGVAVGPDGNPVVTGMAQGDGFTGAGNANGQDAFLIKVLSTGAGPAVFSKLLTGNFTEAGNAVAVDSSNNIAAAGTTNSTQGPTSGDPPPFGATPSGQDAFIYETGSTGANIFSTVIGGSSGDEGTAVAFDNLNNLYLVGVNASANFPLQNQIPGEDAGDIAVLKWKSDGTLVYSTTFGASGGASRANAAAADGTGMYVGGQTFGNGFTTGSPVTPIQGTYGGGQDGFIAKVAPSTAVISGGPDPGSITSVNGASFSFLPSESGSTFKCSLDAPTTPSATCSGTSKTYNSIPDGPHTFYLSLFDAAGSTNGSVASRSWTVDATPPATFDVTAPADNAVGGKDVQFTWNATTDATTPTLLNYTLMIDGGDAASVPQSACSSTCSAQITDLAKTPHTWYVVAADGAGNPRNSTSTRTYTVDGTPPLAFALDSPANGSFTGARPTFTWDQTTDANSPVARYELYLNGTMIAQKTPAQCGGVAPDPCSFTPTSDIGDGPHSWFVKAFDTLENVREVSPLAFTADAAPPTTPTLATPGEGAELTTATPLLMWNESTDATSGIAEYDVELDGTLLGLHKAPSDRTYTPPALSEGLHHWRVVVKDNKGNSATSGTGSFRIDTSDPVASFTVSPNPVLAGRSVTLDAAGSSDPGGGHIAHHEWDTDGDGSFETDGGTTATLTRTLSTPGSFTFGLRVTDTVGKSATTTRTLRVTAPPIVADQLGVSVNHGAQYTNSPNVKITLKFPASTTNVIVSNDGGFFSPTPFAPQPEIDWVLNSSGPERLPKTVYVRFLVGPITSETFTDDIILDERPPVVNQASVAPAAGAARAAGAAKLRTWSVKLKATDPNSGVDAVQIAANKKKPGKFLAYKTKLKVKAPSRKLFVRARDRAGNLSPWKKAR
jgi:hypothetical protein